MIRKTDEEFKEEAKINDKITVIGAYIKQSVKILVKCNKCGNEFFVFPGSVLRGHGCKKCAMKENAKNQMKTQEQFKKEVKEINSDLVVLGQYEGQSKEILFYCKKCKTLFMDSPKDILKNKGNCPNCSKSKLAKTQEEFERDVKKVNPHIEILGEYISGQTPILVKCSKCGYEWTPRATWLLQGKGCPKCNMSKGEKRIESFLIENSINYEWQYKTKECRDVNELPFDFYLPDYNIMCEFDGKQHFEEIDAWKNETLQTRQLHDKIKDEYCKSHGIKMIRIPYWNIKKIDEILTNELKINNA